MFDVLTTYMPIGLIAAPHGRRFHPPPCARKRVKISSSSAGKKALGVLLPALFVGIYARDRGSWNLYDVKRECDRQTHVRTYI